MRLGTCLAAIAVAVLTAGVTSAEQGTVRGVVTSVTPVQEDGKTLYTLTIRGEGPWQAALSVGPEMKQAYEMMKDLKPGERVAVGWVAEGGKPWVREISRIGEGERRDGERKEGERKEPDRPPVEGERKEGEKEKVVRREGGDREKVAPEVRAEGNREKVVKEERARVTEERARETDERALEANREREVKAALKEKARIEREGARIKEGPRDGERVKEGVRDGEGVKVGPRDGERVKEGVRDGEGVKVGPRDGERVKEGVRDGEGVKVGPRDGERVKEGVRDGEAVKVGPRDGEREKPGPRDGEKREGVAARMKTTARVLSVETGNENARVLKLAAVESGEEMTFTVTAEQGEIYKLVGDLKPGATVRVAWKTERGAPMLTGITRAGEER